ncbi:actin or actin-binding cytoskeletal protein [Lithospermum erythrorhizon]|uniref:Actin or actin-binding cytoskeletal protein n=1 Tax=Lithospermum erythrorhizon TaxID=34254 RepID=A0AAV3NT27_LITER
MDLGCIDLGCIENESNGVKIKKAPKCKSSPINWFPRKKVDSYLKRKIQHLQEVDGMNSTLDETLGDANPHYSRVLREKMAVREAAHKALEARKAAMVEASWCRILKAARIESKISEAQLLKAEECSAKAFEAATAIGVIMYDAPDCPTKRYKIETTSPNGGSTTHTIKASFETAFEVDKQVAAAVKSAFMKLETCPSIDKDDLKKLLLEISEHPDTREHYQELSEFSSDCESDTGPDTTRLGIMTDKNWEMKNKNDTPVRQKKQKKRHALEKFNKENLVGMMLERLKGLPEDGLSSLATIVATCGLGAALAEAEIGNKQDLGSVSENSSTQAVRFSSFGAATMDGHLKKKMPDSELPSLDKFLVKRLTRLERDVLEAKNARKNEQKPDKSVVHDCSSDNACSGHITSDLVNDLQEDNLKSEEVDSDLGSIQVKHTSRIKDVQSHEINCNSQDKKLGSYAKDVIEVPSLDVYLVKHMTRLEKEVLEVKNQRLPNLVELDKQYVLDKENIDKNKELSVTNIDEDLKISRESYAQRRRRNKLENSSTFSEGLDKVLVKHVSRLEKEKLRLRAEEEIMPKMKRQERSRNELEIVKGGLDQVLVQRKSRLEIEKAQQPETQIMHSSTRRLAREKELEEAWGGLSLGNSMRPHPSRLEQDKQPTEVRRSSARRDARDKELQEAWGGLSLGNSMRPHLSKLEREKAAWLKAEEEQRRQATEV